MFWDQIWRYFMSVSVFNKLQVTEIEHMGEIMASADIEM